MIYDSHIHSDNSDGRNTVNELCAFAADHNISGITITDHADMNFYESRDTYHRIQNSLAAIQQAKLKYKGELEVFRGIELGEYLYHPENAEKILSLTNYDCILCSVHFVPSARWDMPYNRIPFSQDGTDEELKEYLKLYFSLLSDTVDAFDFDVLAHIACPVRYMTSIHHRPTNVMEFKPQIREILQKIIERNIALEWNTSELRQNEEIFSLYHSLGGRLVTLGSDAHFASEIGQEFADARAALKRCGFTYYHFFKNRTAHQIEL